MEWRNLIEARDIFRSLFLFSQHNSVNTNNCSLMPAENKTNMCPQDKVSRSSWSSYGNFFGKLSSPSRLKYTTGPNLLRLNSQGSELSGSDDEMNYFPTVEAIGLDSITDYSNENSYSGKLSNVIRNQRPNFIGTKFPLIDEMRSNEVKLPTNGYNFTSLIYPFKPVGANSSMFSQPSLAPGSVFNFYGKQRKKTQVSASSSSCNSMSNENHQSKLPSSLQSGSNVPKGSNKKSITEEMGKLNISSTKHDHATCVVSDHTSAQQSTTKHDHATCVVSDHATCVVSDHATCVVSDHSSAQQDKVTCRKKTKLGNTDFTKQGPVIRETYIDTELALVNDLCKPAANVISSESASICAGALVKKNKQAETKSTCDRKNSSQLKAASFFLAPKMTCVNGTKKKSSRPSLKKRQRRKMQSQPNACDTANSCKILTVNHETSSQSSKCEPMKFVVDFSESESESPHVSPTKKGCSPLAKLSLFISAADLSDSESESDSDFYDDEVDYCSTKVSNDCDWQAALKEIESMTPFTFHFTCITNPSSSKSAAQSTDIPDCTLPVDPEDQKRVSDANKTWQQHYSAVQPDTKRTKCKVNFADDAHIETVYTLSPDEEAAYKAYRSGGEWEQFARDRARFRNRIADCEHELSRVLVHSHRENVFSQLYSQES